MPWLITDWGPLARRATALVCSTRPALVADQRRPLAVVLEAFAHFAWEGIGTPAPVAPTRSLVVSGFSRFVPQPDVPRGLWP